MDLQLIEEAAWRTAPGVGPASVARAVEGLRRAYIAREAVPRRAATRLAKLLFYGVADAPKLGVLLAELDLGGALPATDTWDVLDVGAGPGATSLALRAWLRGRPWPRRLRVTAVDRDGESLADGARLHAAYTELVGSNAPAIEYRPVPCDVTGAALPRGPFHLVLCANVLSELWPEDADADARRAGLVARLVGSLATGGSACVIEPALRETARALHRVRDRLIAAGTATVYAPCLRGVPCPMLASERDWCHEDRPIDLPERTRLVARLAGLRRHTLKFAYLTLRRDGRTLGDAVPSARFRVVSERLVSKGRDEVYLCGPPGRLRVLRNRRDATDANAAFAHLDRGRLAALEPVATRVTPRTLVRAWDPVSRATWSG